MLKTKYEITIPACTHLWIWILGTIVLIALTLKEFLPLLNEYKNNNNLAIQVTSGSNGPGI